MLTKLILLMLGTVSLLPSVSYAHGVSGGAFISGLTHPMLGLDHLLAMLGIGMLGAQMGGQAMWRIPLAFVLAMLGGAILGIKGTPLFSVELLIALSVLAVGIAIVVEKKLPSLLVMALAAFFALFHGHAHGTEMLPEYDSLHYSGGFVLGALAIHIAGLLIGVVAEKNQAGQLLRYLGAGIAGIGLHIIIG